RLGELIGPDRLAVRDADEDALVAERLAQVLPALAPPPGDEADHLAPRGYGAYQGRLHAAGAGSRQGDDGGAGLEDVLQFRVDLEENLAELGAAVVEDGPGQLEKRVLGDRGRAGGHQPLLHRCILLQGYGNILPSS